MENILWFYKERNILKCKYLQILLSKFLKWEYNPKIFGKYKLFENFV